jgi:hypothetical protein
MGFAFIVSSFVIIYRDDDIFGDLNIVRFIVLVIQAGLTSAPSDIGNRLTEG